jgi:hypothetical protein
MSQQRSQRRLHLEQLETRDVPSAASVLGLHAPIGPIIDTRIDMANVLVSVVRPMESPASQIAVPVQVIDTLSHAQTPSFSLNFTKVEGF